MSEMFFQATAFYQPLATSGNSWNTSAVKNMSQMFYNASAFNQPLNSWNTSQVTNMDRMFYNASAFNQPLNLWDVALVSNMNSMFAYCPFNQNIGGWVISNVTNFSGFMSGKNFLTLSTTNLDAIYIGWASRPVKPNISIDFGSAKRTSASTSARNILTSSPRNWVITDGGI
jgi:surface protein